MLQFSPLWKVISFSIKCLLCLLYMPPSHFLVLFFFILCCFLEEVSKSFCTLLYHCCRSAISPVSPNFIIMCGESYLKFIIWWHCLILLRRHLSQDFFLYIKLKVMCMKIHILCFLIIDILKCFLVLSLSVKF